MTSVHIACYFDHEEMLQLLLNKGACYNSIMKGYQRPLDMTRSERIKNVLIQTEKLFHFVKTNNFNEVETCIKRGAVIQAKNIEGESPLHYATMKSYDKTVELLLLRGANANATNNLKVTALHYASKFSNTNIVVNLLSFGAIYNPVCNNNKTPKDYTTNEAITEILDLVERSFKHVQDNNSIILVEIKKLKNTNTRKALLNARDTTKNTLLTSAIKNNFSKVKQFKDLAQGNISAKTEQALISLNEGKFDVALDIYNNFHNYMKQLLGHDSPCTIDIEMALANALYVKDSYREALNISEQILERQNEIFGGENKETLSTRSFIAFMLHIMGKNEESLQIYRDVLQKQTQILGPKHTDTLESQFHMALVLNELKCTMKHC
ncbi:serine/threonine-protein phosphatase 6 regulatory ankyrin repeat subunit B-like [Wyeomyia smithii]|uniref:serine/threonine-protein phosphatase 6 regulatory ankyrin repeat subunit B-like n=1 Tax=Wyeomyia smithii TaxID=174621 RepID=UPI002467DD92|nr:serine/threonine-protein phosphatase 6 regulatory ankyrin repeat subunit B-like [Wyeomyia smithii]